MLRLQPAVAAVAVPTWITFGLAALTLIAAFFLPKPAQGATQDAAQKAASA